MPNFGLRVWGGVILGGSLDPDSNGSFDLKFKDTSGYRAGVGVRLAIVSLNLEYQHVKYEQVVLEQIGPFATSTLFNDVNLENNSWVASVSFPLAL